MSDSKGRRLRIIQVFRAPIGGLFRHVQDLSAALADRGHEVGIVCDVGGGPRAAQLLSALEPKLAFGVKRIPMARAPGPSDILALMRFHRIMHQIQPDVVHGHGAKGGLLARAKPALGIGVAAIRAYTPHGGSLNFGPGVPGHKLVTATERFLMRGTDVFTFESQFASKRFNELIGKPTCLVEVVRNGAHPHEFECIVPVPDAADFIFLGEFRAAKGLIVLADALALLRDRIGREASVVLVGGGPEEALVQSRLDHHGLKKVAMKPAMNAREALALGRTFLLPSLFESLPYVLIEAAAAGMDIVATDVGGVSEALLPDRDRLIQAGDPDALATAMAATLVDPPEVVEKRRLAVREHVREHLSVETMVSGIEGAYRKALAVKGRA
jgi:glycosyltransferase involved in cell wall biosynthesis